MWGVVEPKAEVFRQPGMNLIREKSALVDSGAIIQGAARQFFKRGFYNLQRPFVIEFRSVGVEFNQLHGDEIIYSRALSDPAVQENACPASYGALHE